MPFTVTHIAATVPIAWASRWRLPFSALAIGSMVPDIAGFYPFVLDYVTAHSISGVMTHCTPIGVMLYYGYQAFLKQPFFDLFPEAVTSRMQPWIDHPINLHPLSILAVALSAAIGSMTHVVWDGFTHGGGWGVTTFPILSETTGKIPGRVIRWYDVIQHSSSLLLIPMLIGFLWWLKNLPVQEKLSDRARMPHSIVWSVLSIILIGTGLYYQTFQWNHPNVNSISVLARSVKFSGTCTLSLFLVYSIGMNFVWWRERVRPPHLADNQDRSV